jgi:serine/threonine protein kinase
MNNALKDKLGIQKLIGRGGFGDVYRALNNKENRFEAIKVSNSKPGKNEPKLIRYEAGILNHLDGVKGVPKFYQY